MNNFKYNIMLTVILSLLLIAGNFLSAIEVGADAPDFTLKTHDGKSFTLSKLEGKRGAVLVFFATWCPGCMEEVPHVKEFVKKSRDKNVLVYGVNVQQPLRVIKKFVEQYDVNYRVLLDSGEVSEKYGVRGIPYIVGINAEGKVIYADHALPENKVSFIKNLNKGIGKQTEKNSDKVTYINREKLQELQKSEKKLVIVDVLSPESYHKRHIKGAINIPLSQIKSLMYKLPKDGTIVTYCANFKCKASTRAAQVLQESGFKNVYDYEGGIKDWHENNLSVNEGEKIKFIDKDSLKDLIDSKADIKIIDVLSPESYKKAHITGAINIPYKKLNKKLGDLEKDQKIIVYCANYVCQASSKTAELLQKSGFKEVYDYKGGIKEWQDAGLPVN